MHPFKFRSGQFPADFITYRAIGRREIYNNRIDIRYGLFSIVQSSSILVFCRYPTCTIPRVADVTGSEKSPPGGDTAPTILTLPSRSGFPEYLLHYHGEQDVFRIFFCYFSIKLPRNRPPSKKQNVQKDPYVNVMSKLKTVTLSLHLQQ